VGVQDQRNGGVERWVAWAHAYGHDTCWRFRRDAFLELLAPTVGRALDLGCGEGRAACDLTAPGHTVAAMPFDASCFDPIVAFVSLMNVDDPAACRGDEGFEAPDARMQSRRLPMFPPPSLQPRVIAAIVAQPPVRREIDRSRRITGGGSRDAAGPPT